MPQAAAKHCSVSAIICSGGSLGPEAPSFRSEPAPFRALVDKYPSRNVALSRDTRSQKVAKQSLVKRH